MDPKQIGQIIKFHRKVAKLSQEELAKLAGLGKTVVFDLEKGKSTIRLDTLLKIINVLNIKLVFQSQLMELYENS